MSVSIIQQPTSGAIYAKNTVPSLVLEATEGVYVRIIFKIPADDDWEPSNLVFEGTYTPDFDGLITLDFNELYEPYLKTKFPFTGTEILQDRYWCLFNIIWTGISSETSGNVAFKVANATVAPSAVFATWVGSNFLTNQPVEKRTTTDSPEFLSWFDGAYGDLVLKVRWYLKSGGNDDVDVFTEDDDDYSDYGALCYTVDVSYDRLIQLANYLPGSLRDYYDLILIDGKGNELMTQRYVFGKRSGKEKYYLFVNALGGIDTLVCQGEHTLQPELTLNIGKFGRQFVPIDDAENTKQWTQQTGQMPYRWRDWFYELMTVRQGVWKYANGDLQGIVLKTSDIAMGDSGQLASATFSYIATDGTRSNGYQERDPVLHQSIVKQAEEMEDKTKVTSISFEQNGQNYETEAIEIPANKVYVTASGNGEIYCIVNGTLVSSFDPSTDRMPVVIDIDPGDEIQFLSQVDVTDRLTINYYPVNDTTVTK